MPRVLVVSYPWLPAFTGGVKHVATLARYLPEAGWDPIILCNDWGGGPAAADAALQLDWPEEDESPPLRAARALPMVTAPFASRLNRGTQWHAALAEPRPDLPAWSPRRAAAALLGATYPIYGAFPDPFRGWVAPAIDAGIGAIRQYGIGAVVSFSTPDSAHIAGGEIARRAGIPWIPVFGALGTFQRGRRDGRSLWQRVEQRELARRWLRGASRAAAVTPWMAEHLQNAYGIAAEALPVPFDPDERRLPPRRAVGAPLRLVHAGRLAPGTQRMDVLLDALDLLLAEDAGLGASLHVELVGSRCDDALRALLAGRACAAVVSISPRVGPMEAVRLQREADALLLFPWHGPAATSPATLPEQLNARRPIIAIGAEEGGFVERVLRETQAGEAANAAPDVAAAIRRAISALRGTGEVPYAGDVAAIARYGGPEQARRLAGLLDVASAGRLGTWQRV